MRIGRLIVFAGLSFGITATALEGCGSSSTSTQDVCAQTVVCPKATPPNALDTQACQAQVADPSCGSAFRAMKECQTYKAKCNATTGLVDTSGTNSICSTEISQYQICAKTSDAGPEACKARTCSQANANCGEIDNGCGQKITCGSCTNGQTCGGGGVNRCGCACDPSWCGTLQACNTTITCPSNCVAPQFCGGGGIANRCGCAPSGTLGPFSATSVSTATITLEAGAQTSWSGATNARLPDNSYATALMNPGSTTQYLVALSFNVNLPAGAVVQGITVNIERSSTSGLATADYAVYLVKNTQIQFTGDNKAQTSLVWTTTDTSASYGGPTDKWGNTWTAADVTAGGFGVALAATYIGQTGSESARVDAIQVQVHYNGVSCP